MTLIECYTGSHISNMAACLRSKPEKLILLGCTEEMQASAERYRRVLLSRGQNTAIELRDIVGKTLQDLCRMLRELLQQEPDCLIDLTDGEELVIMAVGAVLAALPEQARKRLRIQKFDQKKQTVVNCAGMQCSLDCGKISMTVEELVLLHGGSMRSEPLPVPEDFTPRQADRLWTLVREDPKGWNRSVSRLNEFESRAESASPISLSAEALRQSIHQFDTKEADVRAFLGRLQQCGVVCDRSSRDRIEYEYTSPMMRYCLQKAGNVLEIKTLLEGRAVTKSGKPFFSDCRMSVSIDWDGVFHRPRDRVPETRNEIDVILMHNLTPLFISCKNGQIGEEELYKLHTVASRFGGENAKKMLIATDLNQKSAFSNRAFTQRAWDMDIFLVPDAADLTAEEWREIFLRAMS